MNIIGYKNMKINFKKPKRNYSLNLLNSTGDIYDIQKINLKTAVIETAEDMVAYFLESGQISLTLKFHDYVDYDKLKYTLCKDKLFSII
jgi:hypothetical protein